MQGEVGNFFAKISKKTPQYKDSGEDFIFRTQNE